jgi:hypothetical protein
VPRVKESGQGLAHALARLARGLRGALRRRLARERAAGEGDVLRFHAAVTAALGAQDEREFADAWAQTLVYLLLVGRWLADVRFEGVARERVDGVGSSVRERFDGVVERAARERLPVLLARVDPLLAGLVAQLLALAEAEALAEVIAGAALGEAPEGDPVMHFYEQFLAAYDPRTRAARGVFFTPAPVVAYLVESSDAVLRDSLGLALGLADDTCWGAYAAARGLVVPAGVDASCPFVQVVDPAAGTGTFVIAVIRRAHATMMAHWQGMDAATRRAAWTVYARERLLPRLRGVERMLAPWVIASLRLAMLLEETGFDGQIDAPVLILADTLAEADLLARPISVVLGNPPYGREAPGSLSGGWIRGTGVGRAPIADFVEPARQAGAGGHVKNIYNLYVYFWRWACWQVFERRPRAPGVVAMVTAASFLRGPGFAGMRAHMRACCSQVWLLDLEGDQRGALASDNVFAVSVPVAATTLVRDGLSSGTGEVRRHRAAGGRADKLALCARTRGPADLVWTRVGEAAGAAWSDDVDGAFQSWPRLVDLFPWQHSGAQWKRTWPVATGPELLAERWQALLRAGDRGAAFRETRDRRVTGRCPPLCSPGMDLYEETGEPIAAALRQPPVRRYGFRAFDRRWCLADARLGDFLRPALWWVAGPRQVYLASLLTSPLGPGPAAMVSAEVPDLHYFCGRGGKDIIALWRDPDGRVANIGALAMAALREWYGAGLRAEDVFAYAYALLSGPEYSRRFAAALREGGPRLPLLRDRARWAEIAGLGHRLIALHCFGARWLGEGAAPAPVRGEARCLQAPAELPDAVRHVDEVLQLWRGPMCVGRFAPVSAAVWQHSLSGHAPVPAWVGARLRGGAGRRSSPLDALQAGAWTAQTSEELLALLWTVEATLALAPAQAEALAAACAGPSWQARELPLPAAAERREPAPGR